MVELNRNLQVLQLGELDAPHVLHVGHARGHRRGDVRHAHGIRHAGAPAGDPARHAVDERHHGARAVLLALLRGLRVDLRELGGDERDRRAVLGDAAVHRVVAEEPEVRAGPRVHEPLAVDLPVDLGDRPRQLVVDRVRGAPEAVRAPDHVHRKLRRQLGVDALALGDLLRRADHEAVHGAEVLVGVAPVGPGDAVAGAAGHVEELLVVRVAAALLGPGRLGRHLRQAQVYDAADVARLARHLLVVEPAGDVARVPRALGNPVVAHGQLGQHHRRREALLDLRGEVVHEPHDGLVAVRVAHPRVGGRGALSPVRLHLLEGPVCRPAAVVRRVDPLELVRGVREQLAESLAQLLHGEVLAGPEPEPLAGGQVPVQLGVRGREAALPAEARSGCTRPRALEVPLPERGRGRHRQKGQEGPSGQAADALHAGRGWAACGRSAQRLAESLC
mmetsp:Transcript_57837/g.152212  ORF Transcript_57837/g.152212 Transcript_57837/m.152212 type:complete len:447 (+) Transcript_57837:605-1945(+)